MTISFSRNAEILGPCSLWQLLLLYVIEDNAVRYFSQRAVSFLLRDVKALTCVSGMSYSSLEIQKVVDVY